MKFVRIFAWVRFAVVFSLVFAILANSSTFVLASSDAQTLLGEIVVTGRGENGNRHI